MARKNCTLAWLCVLLLTTLTACIGSDKPRRVVRGQALEKPYVPPINPDLLVPSELLRADVQFRQDRAAIRAASAPKDVNGWEATDRDIERINKIGSNADKKRG